MNDVDVEIPAQGYRWRMWALGAAALFALAAALAAGFASPRTGLIVLSSTLAAASTLPYLRDTMRRRVKPRLVTWGTWATLTGLAAAASATAGDVPAAVFSAIGTVACTLIVVVGFRSGTRDFARLDAACLALVVVGIGLWMTFDRPGLAVLAACTIDLIGLVPTLVHVWQRPDEENGLTYALICAGGITAAFAAWGDWTITALAYPTYVAASTGAVALLALRRPGNR